MYEESSQKKNPALWANYQTNIPCYNQEYIFQFMIRFAVLFLFKHLHYWLQFSDQILLQMAANAINKNSSRYLRIKPFAL